MASETKTLTASESLELLFDNAGGILLQTDTYCHFYDDPKQAATDVRAILSGGDPADWEGDEPEFRNNALAEMQSSETHHYNLHDIQRALDSQDFLHTSGYAETEFLRELTGRKHIDDAEAVR